MYKIELHTTEEDLTELSFLHEIGADIIGGVKIKRFNNDGPGAPPTQQKVKVLTSDAYMKVEIFSSFMDDNLLGRLIAAESVLDVRVHPCDCLDLSPTKTEKAKRAGDEHGPKPVENAPPTTCIIEPFTPGYLHLRVETGKNPFCLQEIFRTLMTHNIEIKNGKKFRQGDTDYVILTVAQVNEKSLDQLRTEIIKALSSTLAKAGTRQKALGSFIIPSDSTLAFKLQGSSSLKAISVLAQGPAAVIRVAFHQALSAFDCDVSIGRITGDNDRVEDIYYFKEYGQQPITNDFLHRLKQQITGETHA